MSCSVGLNTENCLGKTYLSTPKVLELWSVTLNLCWPSTTRIWDSNGLENNRESISCSLLTDDHLWIPPALQQRSQNLMESGNTDVATEEEPNRSLRNTLQTHLSSSRLPFVSIKGKPEPLREACLGFSCTRHLVKYSLFIKGGQSPCRMPL